ncbi:MarR family winged helix-turn-helix transcriptional regulator [Cohnella lupini]|uniref:DNA-binding MarR family transcriptional regulator n=1 Tax=Cohnella lupini TaxID=1294267 RepID=A0A3D9IIV8_9BACL|nr:MarR family transcriptional regulator [Cohnella lupini]RED61723.1 DNA-binding MarR family transcriptional regulator [Cohnella lupini]
MDNQDHLHGSIVVNIFRCSNLLERLGRKLASEVGLTSVHQWFILSALSNGDLSLKQLGKNTLVTKQNMTGMIERLKQGQFVSTYEAHDDRRITLVSLTDKGRSALQHLDRFGITNNEASFEHIKLDELSSFNRCLQQLIENMNDE